MPRKRNNINTIGKTDIHKSQNINNPEIKFKMFKS